MQTKYEIFQTEIGQHKNLFFSQGNFKWLQLKKKLLKQFIGGASSSGPNNSWGESKLYIAYLAIYNIGPV